MNVYFDWVAIHTVILYKWYTAPPRKTSTISIGKGNVKNGIIRMNQLGLNMVLVKAQLLNL